MVTRNAFGTITVPRRIYRSSCQARLNGSSRLGPSNGSNPSRSVSRVVARCVHRAFARSGPVLLGRYHVRALRTPREVRNALSYVLLNARKHWLQQRGYAPPVRIDEASSGSWFSG